MIAALGGYAVPGRHCYGLLCWVILFLLFCPVVSAVGQAQDFCYAGVLSTRGGMMEGLQGAQGFHIVHVKFCVYVCSQGDIGFSTEKVKNLCPAVAEWIL